MLSPGAHDGEAPPTRGAGWVREGGSPPAPAVARPRLGRSSTRPLSLLRRGGVLGRWGALAVAHAVALAAGGDDRRGLGEPIEQGRGELLVAAEPPGPLAEVQIRGDHGRSPAMPLAEHV